MSPAVLAGLLAAASLAPFLNKAISGDSIFYLRVARQMLVSPLRPFDFTLVVDHAARGGWAVANNPPLVSGWYALLIALGGEREWWLHLGTLVFPALAAAGTARLARALWPEVSRGWAVAAGLLLVWTPGVFVNSTDLLYDAGFLAAWVWATALHAEALVEGSRAKRWAAYGCVAAAGMIKSVAILLPPILWGHAWLRSRRVGAGLLTRPRAPQERRPYTQEMIGTLIPLLVWLAWAGHNLAIYGQVQLLKARAEVGASLQLHKEVSFLCALGGATVFLPALLAAAARRSKGGWLALAVVYLAGDFLFNYLGWPWHRAALGGAMLAGGAAAVGLLISEFRLAWRGGDAPTAWLAGWGLLTLGSLAYVDRIFAVRYILPAFPPLALLALRRLQAAWPDRARQALAITLAGTLVTAGGVAVADALWANVYRTAVKAVPVVTAALPERGVRNIYFTGHLGWQYYLEQSGATALESARTHVPPGSLLLVPRIPVPQPVNPAIARRAKLLQVLEYPSDWPVRTCSPAAQAGFHLNLFGVLPWSLSRLPLERIGMYEIR